MLQSIVNKSRSLLIKIILVVIIASFGLFGIGNVFISGRNNNVAKVGKYYVSIEEYNMKTSQEVARLKNFLNSGIPNEVLVQAISKNVFDNLVYNKLMKNEADRLGIIINDDLISSVIARSFTDRNSQFSKENFRRFLEAYRTTEKTYIENIREEYLRKNVLERFNTVSFTPEEMINAVYNYQYETRIVDIIDMPISLVKDIASPSDTELVQYFQENNDKYKTKEEKTFSYLAWNNEIIKKNIDITDEQIKKYYDENIDKYTIPEKRKVVNLIVNEEIKEEEKFEKVDMGFIAKEDLLDDKIKEAIFSLKVDESSEPIETDFGKSIFKVEEIQPAFALPIESVKDKIKKDVVDEIAEEKQYEMMEQVIDAIAGGASYDDVAKEFGLETNKITALKGEKLDIVADDIIKLAFETEDESDFVERENGGYIVVKIEEHKLPRDRALDEVRGTVLEDCQKQQKNMKIQELAELKAGEINKDKTTSYDKKETVEFKRSELVNDYPVDLQKKIFNIEKGVAIANILDNGGNFVIAVLKEIKKPDNDDERKSNIKKNIERIKQEEISEQYFKHLQSKYKVETLAKIEF